MSERAQVPKLVTSAARRRKAEAGMAAYHGTWVWIKVIISCGR
jgi:hypothetical protein